MDTEGRIAALEQRVAQLEQDMAAMKRMLKLDMKIAGAAYNWETGMAVRGTIGAGNRAGVSWWTVTVLPPNLRWSHRRDGQARFLVAGRVKQHPGEPIPRLTIATVAKVAVDGALPEFGHGHTGLQAAVLMGLREQLPGVFVPATLPTNAMLADCLERAARQRAAA